MHTCMQERAWHAGMERAWHAGMERALPGIRRRWRGKSILGNIRDGGRCASVRARHPRLVVTLKDRLWGLCKRQKGKYQQTLRHLVCVHHGKRLPQRVTTPDRPTRKHPPDRPTRKHPPDRPTRKHPPDRPTRKHPPKDRGDKRNTNEKHLYRSMRV